MIGWTARTLTTVALCVAVVLGGEGVAAAAFTGQTAASTTVGTATVAPVTGQSGTATQCNNNGSTVQLSWTSSTTTRVTSYRLTDNGTTRATVNGRTSTSGSFTVARTGGTHAIAIVAVTDYGWTATTAVGSFTC